MCETWWPAVLTLITSSSAISRFVWPRATSASTSASRGVSPRRSSIGRFDAAARGSGDASSSRARAASSSSSRSSGLRSEACRDGVRLPERHAGVGARGARRRRAPRPGASGSTPRAAGARAGPTWSRPRTTSSGRRSPRARAYSASASARQPAAFGVTAAASAAARRAAARSFRARPSRSRTASASRRARASAASSACARSPCGAELDADQRGVARARAREPVAHGLVGVRPAALPQGELGDDEVVDRRGTLVLAHGGVRGLEVRPRGVEVAAADLELCAVDERHVRPVGGDGAERGGADAVGLVPLAARDQGLDLVGDERACVDARNGATRRAAAAASSGRLPRPSEHRQRRR